MNNQEGHPLSPYRKPIVLFLSAILMGLSGRMFFFAGPATFKIVFAAMFVVSLYLFGTGLFKRYSSNTGS